MYSRPMCDVLSPHATASIDRREREKSDVEHFQHQFGCVCLACFSPRSASNLQFTSSCPYLFLSEFSENSSSAFTASSIFFFYIFYSRVADSGDLAGPFAGHRLDIVPYTVNPKNQQTRPHTRTATHHTSHFTPHHQTPSDPRQTSLTAVPARNMAPIKFTYFNFVSPMLRMDQ